VTWFRKKDKQISQTKDSPGPFRDTYLEHILPTGSPAPGFSLVDSFGEDITQADYRGKPGILAFYSAD
jgi:cytochrome oxidase Cu insertion factor (SCO1/SenC/PrrC family)